MAGRIPNSTEGGRATLQPSFHAGQPLAHRPIHPGHPGLPRANSGQHEVVSAGRITTIRDRGIDVSSGGVTVSDRSCQTASTPVRKCVECPARKDAARFEAALRDVIWRVDYVRSLLEEPAGAPHLQELVSLLDTSDVRAVLRLDEAEPDPATRTIQK